MAQLTIKINGYAYTVACEDGQEAHLQDMARQVEQRIESIKPLSGAAGEGRSLVLAALLMADEIHDMTLDMLNLRRQLAEMRNADPAEPGEKSDPAAKRRLTKLAKQAEDIAARLDQP